MDSDKFDELAAAEQERMSQFRARIAAWEEQMKQTVSEEKRDPRTSECGHQVLTEDLSVIRVFLDETIDQIRKGGQSRPRSIAITKIEEARMWLEEEMRTS